MHHSTWLNIDPSIDRGLLKTDIWIKSIMALMFVLDGQKVIHPLHLLSILELKKVRNKGEQLVWGDGDGCCGVVDDLSEYECDDLESDASCVIVRSIMHDS